MNHALLLFLVLALPVMAKDGAPKKGIDALEAAGIGAGYRQPSTQGLPNLSLAGLRAKFPALDGLDDNQAVDVLHQVYYRDIDRSTLAAALNVAPAVPPKSKTLGIIDKWRYESCQDSAAKAPTPIGVNAGLRLCRERFGQQP